jgi:cell division protein FtsA
VQTKDKAQRVWLDGNFAIGDRQFPQQAIEQITSARAWELLEVVRKKLGTAFSPETCAAGVVLTGGSAKLTGIGEAAAKIFGVPAHLGEAPTWVSENMRDPGYHTALGLLYYGVSSQAERAAPARRGGGFLTGVKRLFATA